MGKYSDRLRKLIKVSSTINSNSNINIANDFPEVKRVNKTEKPEITEEQFFRERRMFCVAPDGVRVAEPNGPRYHRAWMNDLSDFEYERALRGFVFGNNMVWYRGDFEEISIRAIVTNLAELQEKMNLPETTEVWSGAYTAGLGSDVLVGSSLIGTITDIFEIYKLREE